MARSTVTDAAPPANGPAAARYRTAAVARMLRMPAATLRIWERRHGVASPDTTPSGHRQYSAADVQRLALIRQLTQVGHSIGSLAALNIAQLRKVATTHAAALTTVPASRRRTAPAPRLAVVGAAAAHRLQQSALRLRIGTALQPTAVFERLAEVRRAAPASRPDALLVFADGLQPSLLPEVERAARRLGVSAIAVVYSFSATPVADAFAAAGIALLREPLDRKAFAGWLASVEPASAGHGRPAHEGAVDPPRRPAARAAAPPHRYDDAALADFATLSSTIACECPRHLAQIVMQLSHFEAYSAQCRQLDAADAALHAYLGQVTGTARALFESALEQVAIREGLVPPVRADGAAAPARGKGRGGRGGRDSRQKGKPT